MSTKKIEEVVESISKYELNILTFASGAKEKTFIRGGICFPFMSFEMNRFSGAITICGSSVESNTIKLYECIPFDPFDPAYPMQFYKIFKKYGVRKYYYRADGNFQHEATRYISEISKTTTATDIELTPMFIGLSFPSDAIALTPFLHANMNGIFLAKKESPLARSILALEPSAKLSTMPAEIQAVSVNVAGLLRDKCYYIEDANHHAEKGLFE